MGKCGSNEEMNHAKPPPYNQRPHVDSEQQVYAELSGSDVDSPDPPLPRGWIRRKHPEAPKADKTVYYSNLAMSTYNDPRRNNTSGTAAQNDQVARAIGGYHHTMKEGDPVDAAQLKQAARGFGVQQEGLARIDALLQCYEEVRRRVAEAPGQDVALSLIHISEPTRLLSISYAVFCLKKKKKRRLQKDTNIITKIIKTTQNKIINNNKQNQNIKSYHNYEY
eukprot:TRINITY_DN32236_c0_g1_i1.p1 TRINITY_DN32236_c0_g1~~TRINITY_DN32236_c0_g1_i1.p1  ORF type:complete len:222 (+),score=35.65 TRINITY_DN32236_c0_g1_i1:1-666(+)